MTSDKEKEKGKGKGKGKDKTKKAPHPKVRLNGLVLDQRRKVQVEKEEGHVTDKYVATFKVPESDNKFVLTTEEPIDGIRIGDTCKLVVTSDQTTLDEHGETLKK